MPDEILFTRSLPDDHGAKDETICFKREGELVRIVIDSPLRDVKAAYALNLDEIRSAVAFLNTTLHRAQ
jgi:hypothetical protein